MENPTWHKIHPDFQLNKASYSVEGLEKFAEGLVEEGQPFQKYIGEIGRASCRERVCIYV